MKSRYSFEDRGTHRQTESISECTLKDLSNDIWHAYQSWKLVGDDENNIPPLDTLGGGIRTSQNSISTFLKRKSNFWVSMVYYSWRPFN